MCARPKKSDEYKSLGSLLRELEHALESVRDAQEHNTLPANVLNKQKHLLSAALKAFDISLQAVEAQRRGTSAAKRAGQLQIVGSTYSRRVTKGLKSLTKAPITGQSDTAVTRHAEAFVVALQNAIGYLKQAIDPTYCSVVIGAYPSVLSSFMPSAFRQMNIGGRFWTRFPNAEIRCTAIGDDDVDSLISSGAVDIAMCGTRSNAARMQVNDVELFAADELGLLIPEKLRPSDRRAMASWKVLDVWLNKRRNARSGARTEPFEFAWLQGLTYFKVSDEFNDLLRFLLRGKMDGLRPSVLVYTNRDVRRYVEEGLGFGLGHRPLHNERSGIHFVSFQGLRIKDLSKEAHEHLVRVLKKWYPIYLTFDPKALGQHGSVLTLQQELLQETIGAIRVASLGFSYRLS